MHGNRHNHEVVRQVRDYKSLLFFSVFCNVISVHCMKTVIIYTANCPVSAFLIIC